MYQVHVKLFKYINPCNTYGNSVEYYYIQFINEFKYYAYNLEGLLKEFMQEVSISRLFLKECYVSIRYLFFSF